MNSNTQQPGHAAALAASVLLLADTALLILIGGGVWRGLSGGASFPWLFSHSPLPVGIYAAWALGIFGTVGAIVAIAIYGFRERWFWRCLLVASVAWLVFPPIHAVIGLLSLILLIRSQASFPRHHSDSAPPP